MRRYSFENKEEEDVKMNAGLKLQQSKSKQIKRKIQMDFDERARNVNNKLQGNLSRAAELAREFVQLINDTRVPEQIGPYDRTFEKESLRKLIDYAIDINNFEHEKYGLGSDVIKEGMGSVSLITLILKTMFSFRDKMNTTSYNIHKLEKRVQQLEKSKLSSAKDETNEQR